MNSSNQTASQPSGRLDNGIAAPYDFSISDVIGEAWSKVGGFKASFWGGFASYFLIAIVMGGIIYGVGEMLGGPSEVGSNAVTGILRVILQILLYPVYAGIMMLGIKRASNLPVRAGMVFRYYNAMWRILGVMLLTATIIMIPSVIGGLVISLEVAYELSLITNLVLGLIGFLFILVGIYLAWAYLFVIQLTTEKRLPIWTCLETSRKAVSQHWWKIFFTTLLIMLIYIISAIPFGIGLIWSLPLIVITQGVLYRRIFGVEADLATNG